MDDSKVHPGAKWVSQPLRNGEWWNVVESNAVLLTTAIHRKSACRHPKACAGWGEDRRIRRRPGRLMVETFTSNQRLPPWETNKGMSDEAAEAAALTYLPTHLGGRQHQPQE